MKKIISLFLFIIFFGVFFLVNTSAEDSGGGVCTTHYKPVCGSIDGEKKTYSNRCNLDVSNASFEYGGKCVGDKRFKKLHKKGKSGIIESIESLDDDTKARLEELKDDFREKIKALRDEFKDLEETQETKESFLEKVKELELQHYEALKSVLGDDHEIIKKLEEQKERLENKFKDGKYKGRAFSSKRGELIGKYRKSFAKKIGSRLDKFSDEKLEKISSKIDVLIEKYENNSRLSDTKKDKIVSQLVALQDIIEEKLEGDHDDEIDLDDILQ